MNIVKRSRRAGWLLLWLLVPAWVRAQANGPSTDSRFDIWEFEVTGNTILDRRAIERTVYPFLGPSRTVGDVEQARRALETLYRDSGRGTVVVTIPEQDVDQGVVRLAVLEGAVDRLLVSGATYFSPEQIREAVPSLAPGRVPDLPQVQKEMLALNAATSDRRITPVLRAGRDPGTVEAELKVDDRLPVHGSLEFNNRYTQDTSRTRATATISYDNLWQRQHSASIGYQTAPQETDDVTVLFGTYTARLSDSPWLLSGYLVDSDTDVAAVGTLGVLGKGTIAGVRFIRPLPSLGRGFQRATLGVDYKDFDESVALTGNQPIIETPVRYGTLNAAWGLSFPGEASSSDLGIQAVVGPRFFGNDPEEFENKRSGSSASFAYLGLSLAHERELWSDIRARLALAGQFAGAPLISNEQFSFGGATSVRGYLESQQFVDDGLGAQLELLSPDWARELTGVASGRLFAFVDAGGGRLVDALPEQDDDFFLWSTGIGFRLALWRRLSAELEWAYPLEDTEDGSIESGDDRWHFNTRFAF
jgi:hemolysin activation/secretion protein